ncbi:MAG TPA: L,D-transpeptidase family protein [Thermoanaerobaculaceae bacterium]|nr:L,D-transpeptidase family protein [Thermoanaerobaculaceae bacterium]HPS76895.1 L,D-transpeptidase family protein [Thermoanaerobaculaceae bacterium]
MNSFFAGAQRIGARPGGMTLAALALLVSGTGALAGSARKVPEGALAQAQHRYARVAAARAHQGAPLDRLFEKAGVPYPAPLVVQVFKEEGVLELWAAPEPAGPYRRVVAWPLTGYSGDLGPKRRRGDRQIPEGFYRIDGFNGASRYHLSLHIDYPNRADRFFAHERHPGNNIFIHGNELTNGCIPIGDHAIEQLYVAVLDSRDAGFEVPAHLFPCRFDTPVCARRLRADSRHNPKLAAFWTNLEEGFRWFSTTATRPVITVDVTGRYGFAAPDRVAVEAPAPVAPSEPAGRVP